MNPQRISSFQGVLNRVQVLLPTGIGPTPLVCSDLVPEKAISPSIGPVSVSCLRESAICLVKRTHLPALRVGRFTLIFAFPFFEGPSS